MEIKKTKLENHKLKAMIYGASGAGKTTFGATAPKPLFISAEGGLLSVAGQEVSYVDVTTLQDLRDVLKLLMTGGHDFETVVIDSITEVNEAIKKGIEARIKKPMEIQHWGELSRNIMGIIAGFKKLDMHVIIIAQEDNIIDEDRIAKIVPSLNGKSAVKIAYSMDIVAYLMVDKSGNRVVVTNANQKLLTKDRTGKLKDSTTLDFSDWVELASTDVENENLVDGVNVIVPKAGINDKSKVFKKKK